MQEDTAHVVAVGVTVTVVAVVVDMVVIMRV